MMPLCFLALSAAMNILERPASFNALDTYVILVRTGVVGYPYDYDHSDQRIILYLSIFSVPAVCSTKRLDRHTGLY